MNMNCYASAAAHSRGRMACYRPDDGGEFFYFYFLCIYIYLCIGMFV